VSLGARCDVKYERARRKLPSTEDFSLALGE
jgi:hypothetical protein